MSLETAPLNSSVTWLDYSERERRRMLEVIHAFDEKDTRDELGIGAIRDALADLFFPGTSTIQRRAKHFLFITWICGELESKRIPSREIAAAVRVLQIKTIYALGERLAPAQIATFSKQLVMNLERPESS